MERSGIRIWGVVTAVTVLARQHALPALPRRRLGRGDAGADHALSLLEAAVKGLIYDAMEP